jgi:PTS system fructose-specific IIC component
MGSMSSFPAAGPFMILATVLVAGMTLGWLAQKIRLPGITGQILAGVLMGPSVLALFEDQAVLGLRPLTHFALALIGVTVGAHLSFRRLRNAGRRLILLLVAESVITPLLVAVAILLMTDLEPVVAMLLAALAISTAPATIVALVRETHSRGVFVKTLIAAVAINNVACIFIFEIARGAARLGLLDAGVDWSLGSGVGSLLLASSGSLLLSVMLGAGAASLVHLFTLRVVRTDRLATASVIALLLCFGLAEEARLSPLLACLALGAVQTNLNPARDRLADSVFSNFEPVILCVFFTLAGLHLSLENFGKVGVLAVVFFMARVLGKLAAASSAMWLAGATARVRRTLGLALIPQAGVAIGLVILIQEDPVFASIQEIFVAVVLVSVTLNEIVGPILTRIALVRSGEVGRERPYLVDFLQEENIVTDFEAESMEEAIEKLVVLLISSHGLEGVGRAELLRSVLEREAEISTCIGAGLSVPHGELPEGYPMVGVMAISHRGLAFDTPDGRPIHCMVLLATPRGQRERHLAVLAALARTLGVDAPLQEQLYNSRSPAHAYEILHSETPDDFNHFLEDDSAMTR